jgi:DNA-binding GntR family transcriptional regulator
MPAAVARAIESKPLARRGLADDAYETLKALIFDRHIEPDSWMAIDILARDLGVSQTPIREALARLESDGLVIRRENGRYRTEPLLTKNSFQALYAVRLLLEPSAAGEAAVHIDDPTLDELRAAERALHVAPIGSVYAQFAQFTAGNAAFHDIIARASGNRFLFEAIHRLRSHQRLAQLYLHHGIVDAGPALEEHEAIVAAIEARNRNAAADLMHKHIERSRKELEKLIESDR